MAYRTVTSGMWGDDRFRRLPHGEAREVWLYLLTGFEVTVLPGLQRSDERLISAGTGLSLARARAGLQLVVDAGLAEIDPAAPLIRIPNAPRHNPPITGKVVRGWLRQWELLPGSPLKLKHLASLKESLPNASWAKDAWRRNFAAIETGSEPVSNRFQIDEQDLDLDLDQDLPPSPPSGTASEFHSAAPSEVPEQEPEPVPDDPNVEQVWASYLALLAPTQLPLSEGRRRIIVDALQRWKAAMIVEAFEGFAGNRWWKQNRQKLPGFERLLHDTQIEQGIRCRRFDWQDPQPKPTVQAPLPVPTDPTPDDLARGQQTLAQLKQRLPWASGARR